MDSCFNVYSTDEFRMYEFKVQPCMRARSHDWTDCPFAHQGEKARRRDPRKFNYSGTICADFRKLGGCSRGNACDFAHGVFESWLHPTRYRTQPCKDGTDCKRKVCFFAHTPRQLRNVPLKSNGSNQSTVSSCHCSFCVNEAFQVSSPTSTLMGVSRFSPPTSPTVSLSYLNLVPSLVNVFEAMNLGSPSSIDRNLSYYKRDFNGGNGFMLEKGGIEFNVGFIRGEEMIKEKNESWLLADLDWVSELVM